MTTLRPIAADALTLPGIAHGFFTREGGVSQGVYASLNCGRGSRDERHAVAENRSRVAAHMGVHGSHLLSVHQIHSPEVVTVDDIWEPGERPAADAMVTGRPGIALGVLAADCGPVLFADAEAGVVGAAHSGWRGAIGGVIDATVAAMEKLGATRSRIAAVLGPTIAQASYEVGPEFHDSFLADDRDNARFFTPSGQDGHWMFDLPGYVQMRMARLGLAHTGWTGEDTYADPARFFSFRRNTHAGEKQYGRMISAIAVARR
jgi:YfiH family protein